MVADVQHLIGQAIQEFESGNPESARKLLVGVLEAVIKTEIKMGLPLQVSP